MTETKRTSGTPRKRPWLVDLKPPPQPYGQSAAAAAPPSSDGSAEAKALLPDTLALALSGGGIRSATFCLGVLQALAKADWLRHVDYLSTVSGGGYVGAFLGRFFDLCAKPGGIMGAVPSPGRGGAQDRVARDLSDNGSAPIFWLRRNSNYLSPTGLGDMGNNLAGFLRNLLSLQVVLGIFFFAVFGIMNAIRYAAEGWNSPPLAWLDLLTTFAPLSAAADEVTPWTVLIEITLWLAVVPLMITYWLVSQDQFETFIPAALVAITAIVVALLLITNHTLGILLLVATVAWALAAWIVVRRSEGRANLANRFRLLLARIHLTDWLAFCLAALLGFAVLGAIDGLGRTLAQIMLEGRLTSDQIAAWFASLGAMAVGSASLLRMVAGFIVRRKPDGRDWISILTPYLWTALILLIGAPPFLIGVSFASQAAYKAGDAYFQGVAFTVLAVLVSLLFGSRDGLPFVNRTGPMATYAARIARAFLGAVNPQRRLYPQGRDITYLVPGDDVALDRYRPHVAGGPLHLINCAINETIDVASQRGLRDRQAENLAVGPAGVNVAQRWHALWTDDSPGVPCLTPVDGSDAPHPFLRIEGEPVPVERLDLRQWIAISGAAVSPGMGRATGAARSVLYTLANLRLGYWWNSGLDERQRRDVPVRCNPWRKFLGLLSRAFRPQSLLLAELVGRFGGPWYRYWYLSDGGHFEATGAYELLRRRVPFVIVCDAGRDEKQQGSLLGDLVRLARVDLGAEIKEWDGGPTTIGVPPDAVPYLGALKDLLYSGQQFTNKHATLLLVCYPPARGETNGDPWLCRRHTWLLYLKATITGDEPADVRNYAALHPDFPNESTLNQLFDEPQWESYRKLGEHIGENLFNVVQLAPPPSAGTGCGQTPLGQSAVM